MKILIIGTPRSGTTTLVRALGSAGNLTKYGEPWHDGLHRDSCGYPHLFENNCVVKTLIKQIPDSYLDKPITSFYEDLVKQFDKVVILGRKDSEELLVSYTYQMVETRDNKKRELSDWHLPYIPNLSKDDLDLYRPNVVERIKLLHKVSEYLKIPITWYEDLFSGNIKYIDSFLDNLDIDIDRNKFYTFVDPKNKLRKTNSII